MPVQDGSLTVDSAAPSPFTLNQDGSGQSSSHSSERDRSRKDYSRQQHQGYDAGASSHTIHFGSSDSQHRHDSSFDLDGFSLGGDFSLHSSLEDLQGFHHNTPDNHFTQGAAHAQAYVSPSASNIKSNGNTLHSVQHSTSCERQRSTSAGSRGQSKASTGSRESQRALHSKSSSPNPLSIFSPTSLSERVMQSANASGQPSPLGSGTQSNIDMGASGGGSTSTSANASRQGTVGGTSANDGVEQGADMSMNDLQSLLVSLQNSQAPQQPDQQHASQQQGQHGGNLSISDLEKLLAEKEQFEQMQNQQTAFLRMQLHNLQRQQQSMQQQPTQMQQHIQQLQSSLAQANSGNQTDLAQLSDGMTASQLMQQFQQMQSSQLNGAFPSHAAPFENRDEPSQLQNLLQQLKNTGDSNISALMSQYGVYTPMPSGGLSQGHTISKQEFVSPLNIPSGSQSGAFEGHRAHDLSFSGGAFTPLESPAITPASVFSNAGSVATTTADIFSPLTSPALRPQFEGMGIMSPFYGPTQGRVLPRAGRLTPNASPAGPQPTKSVPRKNRSTTAEARANRARPSPLIKPVNNPPSTSYPRKRAESATGSSSSPHGTSLHGRSLSQSEASSGHEQSCSNKNGKAAEGNTNEASQSGHSTPSPIEMPPPNGKPITPSSIMGMKSKSNDAKAGSSSNGASSTLSTLRAASSAAKSKDGEASKSVSFASTPPSAEALQNILPSGLSKAEREAWASSMKSSGGVESRRTSHKAAEQKRRDSLKYCFDDLRGMLPPITLDDDVPGGSMLGPDGLIEDQEEEAFALEEIGDAEGARIANRAISKVALLRHSNEYLIRLKQRLMRRDRDLAAMRRENLELRARLGLPTPIHAPFWVGMGVGPTPQADAAGLVDQYDRVHLQQQIQMQMQMGHVAHIGQMSHLDLGAAAAPVPSHDHTPTKSPFVTESTMDTTS